MESQERMGMTAEGGSGLLTVPEVATFLRLKVSTVRAWVLKRRIPYVKTWGEGFRPQNGRFGTYRQERRSCQGRVVLGVRRE